MRAMLAGLSDGLGGPRAVAFTLLYQFRDPDLRLEFEQEVEDLPIVLSAVAYLRLLLFTVLKVCRLNLPFLLPQTLRKIVAAYKRTDLVISAPGGPYFGDIYAGHEIMHWWYVYLAVLYKKPLFLYATSAGPFKHRILNIIRRRLYKRFDRLVTREHLSAEYIRGLIGEDAEVEVTADSAIQQHFGPISRDNYFRNHGENFTDRLLVAVSLNDFRYPEDSHPDTKRAYYDAELGKVLRHLVSKHGSYLLLLPQLYGARHSDVPYLKRIATGLPERSWEIVDPTADSNYQRGLFAMCDVHLASRYHPAIFGNTAGVPGVCIYYEHKALGFMSQLGLERYAFDIREPKATTLCEVFDEIIRNRDSLRDHLKKVVPTLERQSRRTTEMAVELVMSKP